MGWLFTSGQTKKQLIQERTTSWNNDWQLARIPPDFCGPRLPVRATCLAHCYRGNNFSGVLWTVWEVVKGSVAARYIGCDLLQWDRGCQGWGYKDMDESMGPFYYSCPLKYLAMVPVANESWRDGVKNYHNRLTQKRLAKKAVA